MKRKILDFFKHALHFTTHEVCLNLLLSKATGCLSLALNKMNEYLRRNHSYEWDNVSQAIVSDEQTLRMTYGGGVITHLGSQMYGHAEDIIAEYVANAWDADAQNVWVDVSLDPNRTNNTISVKDDGSGMSFNECNEKFLWIGRPRRKKEGDFTDRLHRPLMARKGVGKLAGFGMANVVEVKTVKNNILTHFRMNHDKIREMSGSLQDYEPELLSAFGTPTDEIDGTSITLRELRSRPVKIEQFRKKMSRRFGVFSDTFRVWINGVELKKEDLDYQFRFPEQGGCNEDEVEGKRIRWWFGFTEKPIKDEVGRGVSVIARGRLAQEPFFFGLSGGTGQQLGLQYLVGEVYADYLDEFPDDDLIITGRLKIRWDDPSAAPLKDWGENKIRALLTKWGALRTKEKLDKLKISTDLLTRIKGLGSKRERDDAMKVVDKLSEIVTLDQKRFEEQVEFIVKGYENQIFMDIIHDFDSTTPDAYPDFVDLLKEYDVIKAVNVAQIIETNIEIIEKFDEMIHAEVREKPDMHNLLQKHPWLIDPQWDLLEHEPALDEIVQKYFDKDKPTASSGPGATEPDFSALLAGIWLESWKLKDPGNQWARQSWIK